LFYNLTIVSGVYTITVSASNQTSASTTTASGNLSGGAAGSALTFTISAHDANGNRRTTGGDSFTVVLTQTVGKTSFSGTVVDNQNGNYSCLYNVTLAGEYKLSVTFGGVGIQSRKLKNLTLN
jgi:hypothetical protein